MAGMEREVPGQGLAALQQLAQTAHLLVTPMYLGAQVLPPAVVHTGLIPDIGISELGPVSGN